MHVLILSALIHVPAHAESELVAKSSVIMRFVAVQMAREIHSSLVLRMKERHRDQSYQRIHALHHHADHFRYVKSNKDDQCARASKIILEVHRTVDQSVFSAMIVHKIRLAFAKNVKILASIHVDQMPNVTLSPIPLIAAVNQVFKVTPLLAVTESRIRLLNEIHVIHHPAAKTLNARNATERQDVHAFHHTLVMLIQLAVVRNAYSTQTVQAIWLASSNIVVIRAVECVDKMLNALSLNTYRFVRAREAMKAIHLLDAEQVSLQRITVFRLHI